MFPFTRNSWTIYCTMWMFFLLHVVVYPSSYFFSIICYDSILICIRYQKQVEQTNRKWQMKPLLAERFSVLLFTHWMISTFVLRNSQFDFEHFNFRYTADVENYTVFLLLFMDSTNFPRGTKCILFKMKVHVLVTSYKRSCLVFFSLVAFFVVVVAILFLF